MKLTTAAIEDTRYEGRSYVTKRGKKAWSKHIIWDDEIEGLGLRVFPTGRKTFVLSYRAEGRKRVKTLGKFGPLSLDDARDAARQFLEEIGETPVSGAPPGHGRMATFGDLTQAYVEEHLKSRGSSGFAQQRLIRLHITPLLGNIPLSQIRPTDLWRLRAQVAKRYPSDAGRLSNLVRMMFKWASEKGLFQTQAQAQADVSEDTTHPPGETGSSPATSTDTSDETVAETTDDSGESAEDTPVLAVMETAEDTEEPESLDQLHVAREQLEFELAQVRQELDGVRRHAETESQKLREESADAEKRAGTLSLSVQQLQDALREAESEQERLTGELREASGRQHELTEEIETLDSDRRTQAVELERLMAQLESVPPPPPTAPEVSTPRTSRGRFGVPWLAGALVLGILLGGVLASLLGLFGDETGAPVEELEVVTVPPSSVASPVGGAGSIAEVEEGEASSGTPASDRVGAITEASKPSTLDPAASTSTVALGESSASEAEPPAESETTPAAEEAGGERSDEASPALEVAPAAVSGPDLALVESTVRNWATTWSEQRVDDYLDHYATAFEPPGGMTRAAWEAQRRSRIERPDWIRLSLGPISSTVLEAAKVQAEFDQAYATATYSDEVRKTLVLIWEEDGWKITAENSR